MEPATRRLLERLPKVELHLHLVGAVGASTLAWLMEEQEDAVEPSLLAARTARGQPADERGFLATFRAVTSRVRRPDHLVALVEDAGRRLASANVRYAEVTVTVASHLRAGIDRSELRDALDEGRRRVLQGQDVELAWIIDVSGQHGPAVAWETLRWIARYAPTGTVGFGLGGPELGVPRVAYREVFHAACSLGLRSAPHAGEHGDHVEVRSAIDDLRAERVGHGIAAVDDEALLRDLVERQVTLEICPTSNVLTGATPSYAEHPLPTLHAAGVPITIATDDPGVFGTDLIEEYRLAAELCHLDPEGVVALVRGGIDAAFCSPALKRHLHAEVDRGVAGFTDGSAGGRGGGSRRSVSGHG